jgi:hypothetical protein
MKLLLENWRKYLTERKMQYSIANTGYGDVIRFYDESGKDTDQTLGMMVLDLVDAGVGGFAPEKQIDRMMAVNADPNKNQGGMQNWDSSVFEDYYEADNQKILASWAKMNNVELEQVSDPDTEEEYEDDGEYDFESYYSESKKRNKIHELFGFGKKKMNPDGTECKACKDLKWAQNDVEVLGWQDRYAKSGQWFRKRKEEPKFAEPRMPDDEHYMRGWKKGEEDADDEARYAHVELKKESLEQRIVAKTVEHIKRVLAEGPEEQQALADLHADAADAAKTKSKAIQDLSDAAKEEEGVAKEREKYHKEVEKVGKDKEKAADLAIDANAEKEEAVKVAQEAAKLQGKAVDAASELAAQEGDLAKDAMQLDKDLAAAMKSKQDALKDAQKAADEAAKLEAEFEKANSELSGAMEDEAGEEEAAAEEEEAAKEEEEAAKEEEDKAEEEEKAADEEARQAEDEERAKEEEEKAAEEEAEDAAEEEEKAAEEEAKAAEDAAAAEEAGGEEEEAAAQQEALRRRFMRLAKII